MKHILTLLAALLLEPRALHAAETVEFKFGRLCLVQDDWKMSMRNHQSGEELLNQQRLITGFGIPYM